MTNYEAPEIDVQQLMAGIRQSLSKRNLAERRLQPSTPANRKKPESEIPELNLAPSFQTRSDNHYHVNDLLRFHDREFLRNAYRAILKREPDEIGYGVLFFASDASSFCSGQTLSIHGGPGPSGV